MRSLMIAEYLQEIKKKIIATEKKRCKPPEILQNLDMILQDKKRCFKSILVFRGVINYRYLRGMMLGRRTLGFAIHYSPWSLTIILSRPESRSALSRQSRFIKTVLEVSDFSRAPHEIHYQIGISQDIIHCWYRKKCGIEEIFAQFQNAHKLGIITILPN